MNHSLPTKPLVAITSDLMIRKDHQTAYLTMTYANAVYKAGGIPIILPPTAADTDTITALISRFDAFILSGGDDPITTTFGSPNHPKSTPVLEARQSFEIELITQLNNNPDVPVLAICLGMQMLALTAGGTLNQHLPDTHESHADHWNNTHHINSTDESVLPSGPSYSSHRQAITDAAHYRVLATAHDGIIEAFDDPNRPNLLAVQWHPERTESPALGQALFDNLIKSIKH